MTHVRKAAEIDVYNKFRRCNVKAFILIDGDVLTLSVPTASGTDLQYCFGVHQLQSAIADLQKWQLDDLAREPCDRPAQNCEP